MKSLSDSTGSRPGWSSLIKHQAKQVPSSNKSREPKSDTSRQQTDWTDRVMLREVRPGGRSRRGHDARNARNASNARSARDPPS